MTASATALHVILACCLTWLSVDCATVSQSDARSSVDVKRFFPESIAVVVGFNSPNGEQKLQLEERVAAGLPVSSLYKTQLLHYVDNDVRDMKLALERQGYDIVCCDALDYWIDAASLMKRIDTALTVHVQSEFTRVVVYLAGHGLLKQVGRSKEGLFVLPSGIDDKDDVEAILRTNLRLEALATLVDKSRAKHAFLAIDACHAGAAATRGGTDFVLAPLTLEEMASAAKYEARGYLYASTEDQRALELDSDAHGLFTHHLLAGMNGKADRDGDGLVTFRELTDHVYTNVTRDSQSRGHSVQRPAYVKSGAGEVFFLNTERRTDVMLKRQLDQMLDRFEDLPEKPGEFNWWERAHEEILIGLGITAALGAVSLVSWIYSEGSVHNYETTLAPTPEKLAEARQAVDRTRSLLLATGISAGVTTVVGAAMGAWNGRLLTW